MSAGWCRSLLLCAFAASCASHEPPPASEPTPDSVVPGTIGVVVTPASAGVVVAAMAAEGPAAKAGIRVGDGSVLRIAVPVTETDTASRG